MVKECGLKSLVHYVCECERERDSWTALKINAQLFWMPPKPAKERERDRTKVEVIVEIE